MLVWRSLRTKLLVIFLSLLLVPIIGTGIYGYDYLSRTLLQKAIDAEQQNLNSQALHVQSILIETQNTLSYLSDLSAFQVLSNSAPDTSLYQSSLQVLEKDIQNFVRTHLMMKYVAFYNVIGEQVLGVRIHDDGTMETMKGTNDFEGFIGQVLAAPPDTTHLTIGERPDETPHDLILALRIEEGVVLINLLSESLFEPAIDNPISETWSLRLPIQAVLHVTNPEHAPLSSALREHDDWTRNTLGYYRHNDVYTFYHNISVPTLQGRYTVVLFHTIPANRLHPDLNVYARAFGSLTVGVMFCVIALALFAIDRFVEPIRALKESVNAIRKTERTPMLPKQLPPDEIGELSLAFYTMAIELEAKRQSERSLMEKIIMAQEEERTRIAYDLHDGLIQQLVGARFYLNQCKTVLQEVVPDKSLDIFSLGYESLSSAIVEGRRIMQGLHPSVLDDLGLAEALEELSYTIAKRHNWQMQLELDKLSVEPHRILSVTVYRIAQEALNNASKHADATEVSVTLHEDDGIHLTITDNGIGFNPEEPPESESGWGLRTIKERVTLMNGTLNIDSEYNRGTTITVWIPHKERHTGANNDNDTK